MHCIPNASYVRLLLQRKTIILYVPLCEVLPATFRKGTNVLALLNKVASDVLDLTEFLHCEISTSTKPDDTSR